MQQRHTQKPRRWTDEVRGIDEHSSGLPGRCVANRSTRLEDLKREAVPLAELKRMHGDGVREHGEGAEWGATWAGAAVGLVSRVQPAEAIVEEVVAEGAAALRQGAQSVVE